MIFRSTVIPGARIVQADRKQDHRGYFARVWCRDEFLANGIDIGIAQASVSHNLRAGTLRGMHFAWPPAAEGKLVRCERGAIFDAIVDLRPDSSAYLQQVSVRLDEDSGDALYIPPGVAHGFQTLVDDTTVLYMMSEAYRPELADGVRYDDAAFGIEWPLEASVIAGRDRDYPAFDRSAHAARFRGAASR